MSSSLEEFFAQMQPFLLGRQDLATTREALGTSPSGDDSFAFYRELVRRNLANVMRDIHGPLLSLVEHREPGGWAPLVAEYTRAHPPAGRHPSQYAAALSDFLMERREREPSQPEIYEEIADFCWVRRAVGFAPDGPGDGFDRRLCVRQYSYRIHDYVAALERDPSTPIPEPEPMVLLVYRHWRSLEVRLFRPSAAGLVALARRQDAEVPEALRGVPEDQIQAVDAQLVEHGVLGPRSE